MRRPEAASFAVLAVVAVLLGVVGLARAAVLRAVPPAQGSERASADATAAAEIPEGWLHELQQVDDGVWVLAQPAFHVQPAGNVTIVLQAAGVVLVDTGGSPGAGRRVVEAVRSLTAKPVTAVLVTHWHGDHPLGLAEILRAWPDARTIATDATRRHLADPRTMNVPATHTEESERAFQQQLASFAAYARDQALAASEPPLRAGWERSARTLERYALDMRGAVTLAPAEGFAERLVLDDPLRPVEALFLGRANTDGDALAWLPRQRLLVTGDLVVLPLPFGFGSYPAEWIETLERVRALEPALLVPGHGPPQQGLGAVERLIQALEEVRARVAPLAREGLAPAEVRAQIDLSRQAALFAGDDVWLRRWFDAYWVDPIVACALKEARGEPIVQSLGGG